MDLNYQCTIYYCFSIHTLCILRGNQCDNGRIVANQIVLKNKDISLVDIRKQDPNK
jgi:hypothetical protein